MLSWLTSLPPTSRYVSHGALPPPSSKHDSKFGYRVTPRDSRSSLDDNLVNGDAVVVLGSITHGSLPQPIGHGHDHSPPPGTAVLD